MIAVTPRKLAIEVVVEACSYNRRWENMNGGLGLLVGDVDTADEALLKGNRILLRRRILLLKHPPARIRGRRFDLDKGNVTLLAGVPPTNGLDGEAQGRGLVAAAGVRGRGARHQRLMPPLPVISERACVRPLERVGYRILRQRGSHIRLVAPDRSPVTVPFTGSSTAEPCAAFSVRPT